MSALLNNFVVFTKNYIKHCNFHNINLTSARTFCVAFNNVNKSNQNSINSEPIVEKHQCNELPDQRSLHVAVIGVPNAGKSTFINNLINHRVCPTSCKVHTTRKANKAIYTTGNTQLVFYDTPGLVTQREIKKHRLEQTFKSAYRHAVQNADMIAVMHDVSNSWGRNELHRTVMDTLKTYSSLPSFLILNKIDTLKSKRILLDLIRVLTNNTLSAGSRKQKEKFKLAQKNVNESGDLVGKADEINKRQSTWSNFADVFLVSSITGSGLNDIHDYLLHNAIERAWQYPSETFTDETPEALIVDSVRARLLDYLPQEIPYNLHSLIEYYGEENNTIFASVVVNCPTPRIERLICGESNGRLRQITERVTSDLVETFGKPISLTIATRSKAINK